MTAINYKNLFQRYLEDAISFEEYQKLREWALDSNNEEELGEIIKLALDKRTTLTGEFSEIHIDLIYQELLNRKELITIKEHSITNTPRSHFQRTAWVRYAALLLIIAGTAAIIFQLSQSQKEKMLVNNAKQQKDILPGGNKAILTLADGSSILLDSASNGNIAREGNTQIVKRTNGEIVYSATGEKNSKVLLNTMSTPKGGQYQLILPDGTKVWLNTASSITYPVSFVGKERAVRITGEVYIDVAVDKQRAFRVELNNKLIIHVLGTSFNVNAYEDEQSVKTTLVEGALRITTGTQTVLLKPGQQAAFNSEVRIIPSVPIEHVTAWKRGLFNFEGATVEELLRQVARWYDLEIVYKNAVPIQEFQGDLGRDLSLAQLLKVLKLFNISAVLDGKRLIVE